MLQKSESLEANEATHKLFASFTIFYNLSWFLKLFMSSSHLMNIKMLQRAHSDYPEMNSSIFQDMRYRE